MHHRFLWTLCVVVVCQLLVGCNGGATSSSPRVASINTPRDSVAASLGGSMSAEQLAAGRAALEAKRRKIDRDGPKSFDQPAEALAFFLAQRVKPGEDYPMQYVLDTQRLIRDREMEIEGERGGDIAGITSWSSIGPGNVGGRTRAIVINPEDPNIMYAAGVDGGVWKSIDAGATWSSGDDMMLNLAVCSLVMDPTNPDVLYAGTGEGVYASSLFVRGLGIFKTVDAGETWTQLEGTVDESVPYGAFYYVNKLVISPNDNNRIYAATRFGVWRSTDAGETWSIVLSNPRYNTDAQTTLGCTAGCTDLDVRDENGQDFLLAAFGTFERDGLYRSADGGDTWSRWDDAPLAQGRMTIAFAPSDSSIVYLCMANRIGKLVDVFRSSDGGVTWEPRVDMNSLTGPWLLSNLILATGCLEGGTYHQGWYDNIIAVDPIDPDIVWVGGIDMFRSDDGGRNFGIAAYWIFYQDLMDPPPYQLHPDHHEIVFHPDYDGITNQEMFVGNDGGIFRTQNARAATSIEDCPLPGDDPLPEIIWERMNSGYAVTQYYHGSASQTDDRYIGGAQDNGTSLVESRDTPDSWTMIFGGDGGYTAIHPTNSDIMYVEYQGFPTIYKTTNGGQSWVYASGGITDTDGLFITPFAMDPNDPRRMWTGGRRPWRMSNGSTWQLAGPNIPSGNRISAIGIAPSASDVVYLGFNNGYVVRSENALDVSPTWDARSGGLPIGNWVSSVAVDPQNPDIAYCTYSNFDIDHIYKTTNGGVDWVPIDGIGFEGVPDIPVHWLAVRPCNSDHLYAATELGVFASSDAGLTWLPANEGLAHCRVESLDFQNDGDTLVAFTYGRSAFVADLEPCERCLADFDGNGTVDTLDVLMFLAAWSLGEPDADFNDDGLIDTRDVILFLGVWVAGCP